MDLRSFVKDYLNFSRKERMGLLILIILILVTFLLPKAINSRGAGEPIDTDSAWVNAMKRLEDKQSEKRIGSNENPTDENEAAYQFDQTINSTVNAISLFYFDPNTLDEAGWKKLGLKAKTIQTINNYLSKGGHFYKAEDLKKIFGLASFDYERLYPYIRISSQHSTTDQQDYFKKENEPKRRNYQAVYINTADTSAFIALPGIGSRLAARIVNFRDKLGGFYSVSQISETFGLPDSTFQKIKQYLVLDNGSVRKINVNAATLDELKAHPYIKFNLAKPILAYREEHGNFSKVEDLKKIMAITDEIFEKISPYMTTQ